MSGQHVEPTLGKYRNKLGAEITLTSYVGGQINGIPVLGTVYVAETLDNLFGNKTILITPQGLTDCGYERIEE